MHGLRHQSHAQRRADTANGIHDENGNLPGRPAMTETDIIAVLKAAL
jgi:hypothetical protein